MSWKTGLYDIQYLIVRFRMLYVIFSKIDIIHFQASTLMWSENGAFKEQLSCLLSTDYKSLSCAVFKRKSISTISGLSSDKYIYYSACRLVAVHGTTILVFCHPWQVLMIIWILRIPDPQWECSDFNQGRVQRHSAEQLLSGRISPLKPQRRNKIKCLYLGQGRKYISMHATQAKII